MIDAFIEIVATIKRNKLRTALTGFAVSWGIFILIVLMGAGNGLFNGFMENNKGKKMNVISVRPGWTSKAFGGYDKWRQIFFDDNDIEGVRQQFGWYVQDAMGTLATGQMVISTKTDYINARLRGLLPISAEFDGFEVVKGRFVNKIDQDECRKVVLISDRDVNQLFAHSKNRDPLGQTLFANGIAYKIVGVYKSTNNMGSDEILAPLNTLKALYYDIEHRQRMYINLEVKNMDTLEEGEAFEDSLRIYLAHRKRFAEDDGNAFWTWNRLQQYQQTQRGSGVISVAVWIIGILTLISGIVGVSNIMLIAVKERTKEFGIRKALGARPRQILGLIVMESIAITTLFGYIGMVMGIIVTEFADNILRANMQEGFVIFANPTVDMGMAISATITLIVAGTLAGFFPARKATKVKPIEAMRG